MSRNALVVGINTYEDSLFSSLKAPANDAEDIAQLLHEYGEFNVRRLPVVKDKQNETICVGRKTQVSLVQLEEAIVELFKPDGNPPDTALLYFSGHGLRKSRGIQEGFLATSDVNPERGNWGLSLQWLCRLLQESEVRQQIIILDCCYSGELLNFEEGNPGNKGKGRDRCFIAASREYEKAYEEIESTHSVLTAALLKALKPKQEQWVTNYSLVAYLNQERYIFPQSPIFSNFGEPINLTRRWTAPIKEPIPVLSQPVCPYKGLAYFDCVEEDANYFYGRTALTDELLEKVRQGNFLVVVGASGSGKSSVVRAGLLYQLQMGRRLSGSDTWQIRILHPGEHPLQSLALTFVETGLSNIERASQLAKAEELIETGAVGLKQLITAAGTSRVVLVVDQFEEVFTLCQDSSKRQLFFECLLGAAKQSGNKLCLVLTMRSDFFGKCTEQEYAGLANKIQEHMVTVTPMNQEELEQAIVEPAKKVGLEVEPELVTQMIVDVEGSPGSLPLLQYTLTELWQQRTEERLTLTAYTHLGGVKGTLQKRASEVYGDLSPEEQLTAKRIFLELTQLGEGTEDTRRRVRKQDLVNAQQSKTLVDRVIQHLADAKLIVTNELIEKGSQSGRVAVVDIAHEALIRHWPLLRQWVNENRDALRKKRDNEQDGEELQNKNKSRDYLLQGAKLAEAENFHRYADSVPLSSLANEFVQKSLKRRRNNHLRLIGTITGVILGLAGLTIFAFIESVNSRLNALSATSEALFASDQESEALIQSIKAGRQLKWAFGVKPGTRIRVVMALLQPMYEVMAQKSWTGHQDFAMGTSFSPDGEMIASASKDRTVKLWSRDGVLLKTLQGHSLGVNSVNFSPDGQILASASDDKTVNLWSRDGVLLKTLQGYNEPVFSVSFSPDSQIIATASFDGTVKLWSRDGNLLQSFQADKGKVLGVSFSPDGQTIASVGGDKTVKLWNRNGTLLKILPGHKNWVRGISFSPDGQTIASAGGDNTIKLWSRDGRLLKSFLGNLSGINSVSFSPDGQTIASAGRDKTVRLWRRDGRLLSTLHGHEDWVNSVSFSPDGKTIASVSGDKTVRLWGSGNNTSLKILQGHNNWVNGISFSPDGKTIASASGDKTVKLWSRDGRLLRTLQGHNSPVRSVSFSPDGQILASASEDKTVKLWSLDGRLRNTLPGHNSWVNGVSFSPDGQMLASAGGDHTVKLWSRDGRLLRTLPGHNSWVKGVSFSPDGQMLASSGGDKTVKLWSRDGRLRNTLPGHNGWVSEVSFSPDSQTIASASKDHTVKLWSRDGRLLKTLQGHNDTVMSVSFSPDGQTLASASEDHTVKLWSRDGTLLKTLGTSGYVSLDMLLGTRVNFVKEAMNNLQGISLKGFPGHSAGVSSVSFSPDGQMLASGSKDGTVILWNLNLDDLMVRACSSVRDYLKTNPNLSESDRHLCDSVQRN